MENPRERFFAAGQASVPKPSFADWSNENRCEGACADRRTQGRAMTPRESRKGDSEKSRDRGLEQKYSGRRSPWIKRQKES
jgi:hypothetical protein